MTRFEKTNHFANSTGLKCSQGHKIGISTASSHISFASLPSFFGLYRHSSQDSKCSFVPFANTMDGEIYGARVPGPICYDLYE